VYCWGSNLYGQIGNNSATTNFQTPQQVVSTSGSGSLGNIAAISAGSRFTCALNSSHNVYCWGDNSNGELGNGTTSSTLYPVEVLGVGGSGFLSNITAIAAGSYHVCALNSSGNVYCWGANAAGQLGNNTTTNSSTPVEVLGLNGTGVLSSVTAVSSSGQGIYGRSCAISSGNVYCWGSDNNPGGLSSGSMVPWKVIGTDGVTPLANIVAVSVSTSNNCYVNSSGNVYCEGDNLYGEWGSNLVSVVAYGISTNLTTFMEAHGLLNSGFLSGITSVMAGSTYIYAINSSGTAYAWGNNTNGNLGIGTTAQQNVPVVSGFTNVTSMAAGLNYSFTCAVNSSGAVRCVGDNTASELGNNTSGGQVTTPVSVYGFH
jgi:alpha-tubulin suppressor-like RCC1 family protein